MRFAIVLLAAGSLLAQTALRMVVTGKPGGDGYQATHGKRVEGFAAPYVSDYAAANQIDLDQLDAALFPNGHPQTGPEALDVILESGAHTNGNWTYYSSATVSLHQLMMVRAEASREAFLLALYNRAIPKEIIIDRFISEWRLALFSANGKLLADVPFVTRIPHHEEGMWDAISTGLEIQGGSPMVRIGYAHTGGGGPRDQEFTFRFAIERQVPRLRLVSGRQTRDDYQ
ncbi:MAG TPA: hypothetical protein VKU19_07925 [Bryobacteraceae bacterium]|nr:hypothetical protein [Bryobacteraceae bacterium]